MSLHYSFPPHQGTVNDLQALWNISVKMLDAWYFVCLNISTQRSLLGLPPTYLLHNTSLVWTGDTGFSWFRSKTGGLRWRTDFISLNTCWDCRMFESCHYLLHHLLLLLHHFCFLCDPFFTSACRKRSRRWASATIQTLWLITPPLWWRMNSGWSWSCSVVVRRKKGLSFCLGGLCSYLRHDYNLPWLVRPLFKTWNEAGFEPWLNVGIKSLLARRPVDVFCPWPYASKLLVTWFFFNICRYKRLHVDSRGVVMPSLTLGKGGVYV